MNNNPNNSFITFLYQTAAGRMILKGIMKSGVLKAAEKYAKSEFQTSILSRRAMVFYQRIAYLTILHLQSKGLVTAYLIC